MNEKLHRPNLTNRFLQISSRLTRRKFSLSFGLSFLAVIFSWQISAQDFSEDFENGIPADWGMFLDGSATQNWAASSDGYNSSGAAFIDPEADNIGDGNQGKYFLVSPQINVPENAQVRFWNKYDALGDESTIYRLMISTANQPDITDFIELESWTGAEIGDELSYTLKTINLPAGIDAEIEVYIAFVVENTQVGSTGSGSSWTIDDVMMVSACMPVDPDDVEVSDIGVHSAMIYWDHEVAIDFEIQVVEEGEEIDENAGEAVNTQMYLAEDLEEETSYDIYIKSICPGDVEGEWTLVGNFETNKYGMACESPIEMGNSYSFEGNIMDFPNSFDLDFDEPGTNCLGSNVTDNYLNGNRVYFSFTPEEDGLINIDQMTLPWTPGTQCFGNSQSAVFVYDGCDAVGVECMAAVRTTAVNQTVYIDNFPVEADHTYIIVISTIHESEDSSVCFEFNFDFVTCPTPAEISYDNLLQNSVNFTWDNPFDLGDEWEYAVVPQDAGAPTSGTLTDENEDVLIDGLEAGEAYNFYVRSICGGEPSAWSEPYPFATQCEVYDLTYYTDFTTGSSTGSETCWTVLDLNNDNTTWDYLGGWDGIVDAYASIVAGNNQNNNHDYLISPQVNIPDDDVAVLLSYKHQITAWDPDDQSSYSIKLSTTGIGVDDFSVVIQPTTIINNTDWEEVIYEIPDEISGPVNIAWIIEPAPESGSDSQSAFRLSIADVRIYQDCQAPSDLDVLDFTENSALLTWTPANDSDTEWEIVINNRGEEAPTDQDTGTLVDTAEYWAEDLADSNRFEYYVRTACSETARSAWVGPFEFHTLCTPVMEPYFETFNEDISQQVDPDTKRFCWDFADANEDGLTWEFTSTFAKLDVAATGNDDWLISPAIILDGENHKLEFKHRSIDGGNYGLEVLISDSDADLENFTELFTYEDLPSSSNFQNIVEYFEASGTIYLAIRVNPELELSAGQSIHIDDFSIETAEVCPNPTDIQRDAETNTFTWTAGYDETQWEVALIGEGEFFPTNGEMVYTNSYTITEELEEGKEYKFFVRAICDTNNSSVWTGPYKFITDCGQVFDTPFLETFENDSESLNCWSPNAWFLQSALTPFEGDYSANVYTWGSDTDRWMISPAINVQPGQMLSFYYKASQYAPGYTEDLKVWLSTSGNTIGDFTELLYEDHDFANTEWRQASVALPDGITGEVHIAFEIPTEITNVYGYRQNTFIDNVLIDLIPECPAPFNVEVASVGDTQFELSWESLDEDANLEVLVLPYGTQNPFDNIDPDNIHLLTTNPGTVSGLDPATAYDVYIRSSCSDDNVGDWSDKIEVVTMCDFDEQCLYTITLHSGDNNTMGIAGGIDVMQNGYIIQTLEFPTACFSCIVEPIEYQVYLCDGVEFSLFWDSFGFAPNQYPEAWVKVEDSEGEELWMSDMGVGVPKTTLFTGTFSCSDITCEQPTDLTVDEQGELTWTPGGNETQWEVYIQPYGLGALPSQGIVVNEPSYMPTPDDFINGEDGVYEYFVRAICNDDDKSFWSGPKVFILNDDSSNGVNAPVNETEACQESLEGLTFLGSTPSSEPLSLDIPLNNGDIWVDFVPTSPTHHIELGYFPGPMDDSGHPQFPEIIMVLYKENEDGSLEELGWSDNNVLRTMYSMEVEPGENYKIRLININEVTPNEYVFKMCITTLMDPCNVNAPNYSFEKPNMVSSYTTEMMVFDNVIPGWRDNSTVLTGTIFYWGTQNDFFPAYHAGQMVQVPFQDTNPEPPAHNAEEVPGIYQDFNTEEISQFDYSFAHRRRVGPIGDDPNIIRKIQLFAGPVGGPYQLIKEEASSSNAWNIAVGKYNVPEGQDKTRFIFRSKEKVGFMVLDEASFIPNNKIETTDHFITCDNLQTTLKAEGYGEWSADENNPAPVNFEDATAKQTDVTGFMIPGEYTFYWTTRYCEHSVTVTYYGIEDSPEVESPIEYCRGQEADPLSAEPMDGYTLVYFSEAGGEAYDTLTPDTSVPGTYIYYAGYESEDGCMGPLSEIEVIISEGLEESPVVESPVEYCLGEEAQPLSAEPMEGYALVFFDDENGEAQESIIPDTSEAGTFIYYAAYQSEDGCMSELVEIEVVVNEAISPEVTFYLDDYTYCSSDEVIVPELEEGFVFGGTFTATPAGLNINPEDGTIDLTNSESGIYTITYTIEEDLDNCVLEATHSVEIEILPDYEFALESYCSGSNLMVRANFQGESPAEVVYHWTDANGDLLSNDEELNFTTSVGSVELPANVYLTIEVNGCSYTQEISITRSLCKIPEGISPNGDGLNDNFNLTGMGVKKITIYNRYGTEVYSKENYTNEWYGQSNKGKELPSATYYYVIKTIGGETIQGWVYVNREY